MKKVAGENQMGHVLLILLLVVAALGIAGWYITKQPKSPTPTTTSNTQPGPANTRASGSGTPEDLTFTGTVAGHMTQGRKGDTYVCSTITTGPIVGKIGDTDYTFEYRALTAKGPGTYKGYIQIGPLANKNLYYGGDNVSLTINSDRRSGSVEGDLSNLTNPAEKVHISGNWTCPPDY